MSDGTQHLHVMDFHQQSLNLLEQYPDQHLLLLFYNNQCLGCTGRAIPLAYELQKQFSSIQVIGIHANFGHAVTEEEIRSIFTIDELPFPIYIDEKHKLYDFFRSEGTPQWILLRPNGTVFRSIFGSQQGAQNRLYYALEELIQDNKSS